ncbi:hypothetical protein [Pelovirga terrestris]|uniref:Uncharacterized protein n=1 Tax=Pelovirga terrestris TaxID=2771352 RepID=A0A8J6QW10_9BACT|nr:hypothetical protein [Pelovirga terrestris]MBD1399441.1 hypothetical protein [Pelovirga terrestris]
MAEIILRISTEGTFGTPYETAKKMFEVIKDNKGAYYFKFTKKNELLQNETIKKRVENDQIAEIMSRLSAIKIPAFPNHQMGCDGGFTELEVGGYEGKSHFRWWSGPPQGWEELDDVARLIIETISTEISKT